VFVFFLLLASFVSVWFLAQNASAITNEVCSVSKIVSSPVNITSNIKTPPANESQFGWKAGSYTDVDLGKKERICFVDFSWREDSYPFLISASSIPDSNFTNFLFNKSTVLTAGIERYDFQDISARYLKIVFPTNMTKSSLTEIVVYSYHTVSSGSRLPELPSLPPYDNFENKSVTANKWKVIYTSEGFAGRMVGSDDDHFYRMYPQTSKGKCTTATLVTCTYATLVTSTHEFSNFVLVADVRTDDQLRRRSPPNTWEVAWIFFRYSDTFHYYWVALKPNGIELGKKDCDHCTNPVDGQINLLTAPLPTVKIGEWSQWRIEALNNHISVYIDGNKVLDFIDSNMSKEGSAGKIAMYTEDAKVSFDNFFIKEQN